jgi:hypothetical protein
MTSGLLIGEKKNRCTWGTPGAQFEPLGEARVRRLVYMITLSSPVVFAVVLLFTVLDVVVIAWIASRQYMALVSRSRERIEVPASSVQA